MSPVLIALRFALFVSVGSAVGLLVCAVLSAPSLPPARLGLRGYKRTTALRENEAFALFEPVLRWLSTRLGSLVSPALRERLDQRITRAGDVCGLLPEDIVSITVLSSVGSLGLGVAYVTYSERSALLAAVAFAVGVFGPYLQLSSAAQKRVRSIQRALPPMVDLMVLGLGAGLDFAGAVRQVVDKAGRANEPLVEELRLLLQELKLGRTRRQALIQFADRAPCEQVRDLVSAVTQSEEQGTPLAAVLKNQATSSRQRRSVEAEESAARAGTSLMIPLGLLFVAVLMLIVAPMVLNLGDVF